MPVLPGASPSANLRAMSTTLDPLISEFSTQEEADAYDTWFRAKVQEALDDTRPPVPHDEVVRRMEDRLSPDQQVKSRSPG